MFGFMRKRKIGKKALNAVELECVDYLSVFPAGVGIRFESARLGGIPRVGKGPKYEFGMIRIFCSAIVDGAPSQMMIEKELGRYEHTAGAMSELLRKASLEFKRLEDATTTARVETLNSPDKMAELAKPLKIDQTKEEQDAILKPEHDRIMGEVAEKIVGNAGMGIDSGSIYSSRDRVMCDIVGNHSREVTKVNFNPEIRK